MNPRQIAKFVSFKYFDHFRTSGICGRPNARGKGRPHGFDEAMGSISVPLTNMLGWGAKAGCCTSFLNPPYAGGKCGGDEVFHAFILLFIFASREAYFQALSLRLVISLSLFSSSMTMVIIVATNVANKK